MAYQIKPGGLRLPCIKTPEDVDKLDYLTEEEKKIVKANIHNLPPTDGWWMLGNDPHVQFMWQFMEREITALHEGDTQMKALGGFMSLASLVITHRFHSDYMAGVMNSSAINGLLDNGRENELVKLTLLDYPDDEIWSAEESLTIKFVNACVDHTMTDEIFQEAIDTWGEKMVLRHISWIAFLWFWQMFQDVTNMKFHPATDIMPRGGLTPEAVEQVVEQFGVTSGKFFNWWTEEFCQEFAHNERLKALGAFDK